MTDTLQEASARLRQAFEELVDAAADEIGKLFDRTVKTDTRLDQPEPESEPEPTLSPVPELHEFEVAYDKYIRTVWAHYYKREPNQVVQFFRKHSTGDPTLVASINMPSSILDKTANTKP